MDVQVKIKVVNLSFSSFLPFCSSHSSPSPPFSSCPPPFPPSSLMVSSILLSISQFVYCQQCFIEMPGDTITLGSDPLTATVVHKSAFKEMKNDAINYEP